MCLRMPQNLIVELYWMYFFTVEASIELQMSVIIFYDIITLKNKAKSSNKNPQFEYSDSSGEVERLANADTSF